MKIERDKWYLTRGGDKVLVLCVDAPNKQPVIVMHADGEASNHGTDGRFYVHEHDVDANYDLVSEYVEPPKPREVWVYVSEGEYGSVYEEPNPYPHAPKHAAKLVKFREVIE